jgi:hypothetical protein
MEEERPRGISAFIIANENTRWMGPSIESIMPMCDEILIVLIEKDGKAKEIADTFTSHKIKKIQKPVINIDNCPKEKIMERCKEWAVMNTKYSHICEWGNNMLMLQEYVEDHLYNKILSNDRVKFMGYNVTSGRLDKVSREKPNTELKSRAYKYASHTYDDSKYEKIIKKIKHHKSEKIKEPIYLNTENTKVDHGDDIKINLDLPNFFFKKIEDYI